VSYVSHSATANHTGTATVTPSDSLFVDDICGVYAIADSQVCAEGMRPPGVIFIETVEKNAVVLARMLTDVEPTDPDPGAVRRAVVMLFSRAAKVMRHEYGLPEGEDGPMASATLLVVGKGHAVIAHVGMTRAVLVRWDKITRLSRMHSVAARMIRDGEDVPGDSPLHKAPAQGVGQPVQLRVEVACCKVADGDCFVLSTDGVHDFIEDSELLECHAGIEETHQLAEAITALTARRTEDDRTSIVIDIEDEDAEDDDDEDED
jgi:serine/threonine protein phosphatase PrpC